MILEVEFRPRAITANVSGLGEVADFENKTSYQNLIRQFCQTAVMCWAVYQH